VCVCVCACVCVCVCACVRVPLAAHTGKCFAIDQRGRTSWHPYVLCVCVRARISVTANTLLSVRRVRACRQCSQGRRRVCVPAVAGGGCIPSAAGRGACASAQLRLRERGQLRAGTRRRARAAPALVLYSTAATAPQACRRPGANIPARAGDKRVATHFQVVLQPAVLPVAEHPAECALVPRHALRPFHSLPPSPPAGSPV